MGLRGAGTPEEKPGTVREIGSIVALRRYPVKPMAAEALASAAVERHGLAGDRRWGFVRLASA